MFSGSGQDGIGAEISEYLEFWFKSFDFPNHKPFLHNFGKKFAFYERKSIFRSAPFSCGECKKTHHFCQAHWLIFLKSKNLTIANIVYLHTNVKFPDQPDNFRTCRDWLVEYTESSRTWRMLENPDFLDPYLLFFLPSYLNAPLLTLTRSWPPPPP